MKYNEYGCCPGRAEMINHFICNFVIQIVYTIFIFKYFYFHFTKKATVFAGTHAFQSVLVICKTSYQKYKEK